MAATTRCSRSSPGAVLFGTKRGRKTVNIAPKPAPDLSVAAGARRLLARTAPPRGRARHAGPALRVVADHPTRGTPLTTFVDRVVLHVAAGDGGHGCASVHREKFKPLGGPDGADGGHGGDVVLVVDHNTTTLLDYHFHPHQKATSGKPGAGDLRTGASGQTVELPVPDGTVVLDADGNQLADLVGVGTRFIVARGGRGGLGNASLATPKRKAPGFALLGEPGQSADVVLELKSVADVALVGFPSAGKSSLIAAISSARPKIADYPFTTLVPNLGVVEAGGTVFTVADVPGLIPGASQGKGLGLEFLRHVERCTVLVHVLDTATFEADRDPLTDLDVIEAELRAYQSDLADRPRVVVLNKIDVPDGRDLADIVTADLEARGLQVFPISAVTREGLRELAYALGGLVAADRATSPSSRRPASCCGRPPSTTPASPSRRRRTATASSCGQQARALGAADRVRQ